MKKHRGCGAIVLLLTVMLLGGCSKSAGSYYKEGMKSIDNGQYEEAAADFTKAIELKPDKAEYYIDNGMVLIMLGKYDDAQINFDKAILDKENQIVNENNKLAYRGKGIAYYDSHDYAKAVENFDKALEIQELSDVNLDILYYKACSQEKNGQFKEAVNTYTDVIKKQSSNAEAYSNRAFAYGNLGDMEKSLADYDKAISMDKDNYDYYFGKYQMLTQSGNADGAADVLNQAAAIKVSTKEDKYNLAKVYYFLGNYKEAITEFNEAYSDGFTEAYYYLGEIYNKEKDYESAVYNYEMYIKDETTPESAIVYNQLGSCLLKLEKYKEALTYIDSGVAMNQQALQQPLLKNQIICNEKLGNYEVAYKIIKNYRKLYPEDKEAAQEYEFIKTRLPEVSLAK